MALEPDQQKRADALAAAAHALLSFQSSYADIRAAAEWILEPSTLTLEPVDEECREAMVHRK